MTDIRVFTASAGDSALVDALFALEAECFGAEAWSRESVRSFVENPAVTTVYAVVENAVAGMASAIFVSDEAEITKVAVAPEYRRRGVARIILSELEARLSARGVHRLLLEVRETNAPARALYESAGFTVLSTRAGYYASPREDAVIMEKFLPR